LMMSESVGECRRGKRVKVQCVKGMIALGYCNQ
jgi:hypothetical protein